MFSWLHGDMPGIDPTIPYYKLAIRKYVRSVKQKMRFFNQERYDAISAEVEKLLRVGFIREVEYPKWVSNVVLMKMSNGKWQMCVDFIDLNKAYLNDSFPLPKNDQLVDLTTVHSLLSFMVVFLGYNQIPIFDQDEKHTAFITNVGLYSYKVMPFSLKNTSATY